MSPIDLDPEVVAELEAIDATLAGEAVDPQFAELAELALLLSVDRPAVDSEFAQTLDERVENFFRAPLAASRRPRRWFGPLAGFSAAMAAAVLAVVVVGSSGGGAKRPETAALARPAQATTSSAGASSGGAVAKSLAARDSVGSIVQSHTPNGAASNAPAFTPAVTAALQPPQNGRKVVQSANLALNTAPNRIEAVAQQVFDVIGREHGVVKSSTVNSGSQGYAQFQLSVPSGQLSDTMSALSQLRYASVASRTDVTQDVNNSYVGASRSLADDRALRTRLLRALAGATTPNEIDSLKARIHDADAAISRDEASLRSLNNKVNTSQISVSINGAAGPVVSHHSGSFTLGQAAHDAGRVLTVAAGVTLILLAAMVPLGLALALLLWISALLRRRRREQALDLA